MQQFDAAIGDNLQALSSSQFSGVTAAQIGSLSEAQLGSISSAEFGAMTSAQAKGLTASQIASLTDSQAASLSTTGVSALSTAILNGMSPEQLGSLTQAQVQALTSLQIAGLSQTVLSSLKASYFGGKQVAGLSASSLSSMSVSLFDSLVAPNVASVSTAAIRGLMTDQIQSLTSDQASTLTSAQLSAMNASQKAAIIANPSVLRDVQSYEINGSLAYQGALRLLQDAENGGMNASKFANLQAIAKALNASGANGIRTSAYVQQIFDDVVLGTAANATYNGGSSTATQLGNLTASSSQTQMNRLIGKWFLGTDNPSLASKAARVISKGSFSAGGIADVKILGALLVAGAFWCFTSISALGHEKTFFAGGV
jgi:hypothetical protein